MKMIIAIIRDNDYDSVSQALLAEGLRVTRIASTGGFLRRGSSTLMIGLDDDKVDQGIEIIRENTSQPDEPSGKRATIFVLNVSKFTQV